MAKEPPPSKNDSPKSARTRADIIKTAHDLFIQNGYHGTSMRQIANQAHLALGGIYNHFASKEDIFREVVLAYHPYHEIFPILASAQHDNIEDLLRHTIGLMDEVLDSRPELLHLMFIEMVELQSKHIPDLLEKIFPIVGQILQRFMETGDNLRPIPLPMLMRTFVGTFLGYFITKNVLGEHVPAEFRKNAREYFIDIYLHGILKPETRI